MAARFDIHDRSTWAWTDRVTNEEMARVDDQFAVHLEDPNSFYQTAHGMPRVEKCPMVDAQTGMVFDPRLTVCVYPEPSLDGEIYDWAVASGHVKDQR